LETLELETPVVRLAPRVLARETIEPALDIQRMREVIRVEGRHRAAIEYAQVERFGQDEFHGLASV
jgi:hypothetical protein